MKTPRGGAGLFSLFGSRIRNKLTMVLLAMVLIPLIIIIVATNMLFGSYIQNNAISQLEFASMKIGERFQLFNKNLNDITANMIFSDIVQKSLKDTLTPTESITLDRYLKQYGSNYIDAILYMDNKGHIYSTSWYGNAGSASILRSAAVKNLKDTYAKLVWSWQRDDLFSDDGREHLFVARYVRHLDLDLQPGILILKINSSAFDDIVGSQGLMEDSSYLLMDQHAATAYTRNTWVGGADDFQIEDRLRESIAAKTDGGISRYSSSNKIILSEADPDTQWKIVSVVPFEAIMTELRALQGIMLLIVAVAVVGTFAVSFVYANRFTHPISSIVKSLRDFRKGDFGVRLDLKRHDEFQEIARSFNQMALDINDLLQTIQKDQETIKISELNSLIYQINPHFIYNTLDNIHMMSRLSGDKKTGELIQALSRLLRISLSKGHSTIALADEFEHACSFLKIQNIRYEGLFEYRAAFEPEIGQYKIIKFILQPLIENCIAHGFQHMENGGLILVTAARKDDRVVIAVEDNGQGIDERTMERLNGAMHARLPEVDNGPETQGGYGIGNVAARLRLSYGDGVTMGYENLPSGGSRCTIEIQQQLMLGPGC